MTRAPARFRAGLPRNMTRAPIPDSPLARRFVASPNYGERRGYGRPDCLILHYTGMPTGEAALKALTDPASRGLGALSRLGGRLDRPTGRRERARLARRQRRHGRARPTSTRPRSGSRSSIPAMTAARRRFPQPRSRRRSSSRATSARAGELRPSGSSPIPTSPRRASAIPARRFPWESAVQGRRRPLDRARADRWRPAVRA